MRRGRTVLAMDCVLAGAQQHRGRPLNSVVRRHLMSGANSIRPAIASVAVIVYAYGLFVGALILIWRWLLGGSLPNLELWQYIVAPFGIGALAIASEYLGVNIGKIFGINRANQPKWKQSLGITVLFLLLALLIIGPALYKIAYE